MLLENENLMNYEAEKKFITSPYNKLSFYIPGKGITVDDDGNIRFLPIGDINEFVYGQDIEPELLFDEYQLTAEEKEKIRELQRINAQIAQKGISAVYLRKEKSKYFIFITTDDNPEVFYKISENDIDNAVKRILEIEALPGAAANTLEKAYEIRS